MYKINQKTVSNVFLSRFQNPSHLYPTRFSELNYVQPIHNIKTSKYSISIRGPYDHEEKQITTIHKFKPLLHNVWPFFNIMQ